MVKMSFELTFPTYRLLAAGGVQRSDGACIPEDAGNADWRDYLSWREMGGVPDPVEPPPPDPTLRRVHPYYFRLRFTAAQRLAIATSADPLVIDLRDGFAAADTIGLDDLRTAGGLALLVNKGMIAAGDIAALLADRKPEEKP